MEAVIIQNKKIKVFYVLSCNSYNKYEGVCLELI